MYPLPNPPASQGGSATVIAPLRDGFQRSFRIMQPSFGTSQKIIRQRPASRKEGRKNSNNTPCQRAAADGSGKVTDTMQEPSAQAQQKQNRDEQTAPMPIGDRSQNRENKAEVLGTASQGATADTAGCSRVSRSCGHGSCKRGGRNQHELQRRKRHQGAAAHSEGRTRR